MTVAMESAIFMGKNHLNNCQSIANTTDLTLKQMFVISTRLVFEQDEISRLETFGWGNHSWKFLSLFGDERIINLQRTKIYVFLDSVLCLGKIIETLPVERCMGTKIGMVKIFFEIQKLWQNQRRYSGIRVEYFPRYNTLQLDKKSQTFTVEMRWDTREFHKKNHIHDNVQWYFSWKEDLKKDESHWFVLVLKRSGTVSVQTIHKEYGTNIADKMLVEFTTSGCPIFRITSPLSRCELKSKRHGKLSIYCGTDLETFETIFRIIVFANQLSHYGAIAEMCEEYESFHGETRRPVVMEQSSSSLVPNVIQTAVPLDCDDPVNQDFLLQQYGESCHNKTNRGKFVRMHDFWMLLRLDKTTGQKTLQIFHNFMQWLVVSTLFQEKKKHHNQKDGSKGTQRLGRFWKLQPVTCIVSVELKSEIRLWETILILGSEFTMDQIGFFMNLNNNETEISEVQIEEYALKLDAKNFAFRSNAEAKPQRRELAGIHPRIVLVGLKTWTDLEQRKSSFSDCEVSKNVMYLFRYSQNARRKEDGAIHFWRIKENLQNHFPRFPEHSKRNIIDLSLQKRMKLVIQNNFFQYINRAGCAFNFAFNYQLEFSTRRSKFEQKTNNTLSTCWS